MKEPPSSLDCIRLPPLGGDLSLGLTWSGCLGLRAAVGFGIVLKSLAGPRSKGSAKLEICDGPGVSLLPAACIKLCKVPVCSGGCRIRVVGGNGAMWLPGRETGRELQC